MVLAHRVELSDLLKEILDGDQVYFQPKQNTQIEYPCIVYKRDNIVPTWAGNKPYTLTNRYLVTHISRDPDSDVPDKLASLEKCVFDRSFVADNLYHFVFTMYF